MDLEAVRRELLEARAVLDRFLADPNALCAVCAAVDCLVQALRAGRKILACGNGGSMCDAMHFAAELAGKFREVRRPLPALVVSDPAYLTCTANDFGYENIFSRYTTAMGESGDVLLVLSTSGNSTNVVEAAQAAKAAGMKVVALTGRSGGQLAELADVEIRAPYTRYAERVQEIHIKVIHVLVSLIERRMGLTATDLDAL